MTQQQETLELQELLAGDLSQGKAAILAHSMTHEIMLAKEIVMAAKEFSSCCDCARKCELVEMLSFIDCDALITH